MILMRRIIGGSGVGQALCEISGIRRYTLPDAGNYMPFAVDTPLHHPGLCYCRNTIVPPAIHMLFI